MLAMRENEHRIARLPEAQLALRRLNATYKAQHNILSREINCIEEEIRKYAEYEHLLINKKYESEVRDVATASVSQ
jgi:hypothetical protein